MLSIAAAAALLWGAGCGDEDSGDDRPLGVVATTTEVADMARQVGGSRAGVRSLLHPGADPHDFEPRPSDVRAIANADLVLRSGGEVDDWARSLLEDAGGDARTVDLLDSVRHRGDDPHWWQDPLQAVRAVGAIERAMATADRGGRIGYARRARRYVARLRKLDRGIRRCLERVPAADRKLVTTHDSLGYFAARYGVEVVGSVLPSLSTQAQPSARDVERLVDRIRAEGVRAVFPESALSPRLERAVSREAGVEVGGTLWADSLGPRGSGAETYVGAMASNVEALVRGMSGGAVSCRPAG